MPIQILRAGASERKALDSLQDRILKLENEIKAISAAPRTVEDVRAAVRHGIAEKDKALDPAYQFSQFRNIAADGRRPSLPKDWLELLFMKKRPEVIEDLILEVLAALPGEPGLPLAERPAKIADLQRQLENAERAEELCVLELEAAGHTIIRREGVNAKLLLEIWESMGAETNVQN